MIADEPTGASGVLKILLRLAVALALVGLCALGYWTRQQRRLEAEREAYGALLFDIAENGMRVHLRMDQYHPEHIEDWFISLAVSAQLVGIRLDDGRHRAILALGIYGEAEGLDERPYVEMYRTTPAFEGLTPRGWRRGGPRGAGRGMGWASLPEGPYTFTLALDAVPWRERSASLSLYTVLGAALAAACALLAVLALQLRERQKRLRLALGASEEQAKRQTMLAQLGAGLAHETKNPLGLIRGFAQGILERADAGDAARQRALQIIDETDRVVGQIDGFLTLAKPIEPRMETVALGPLLEQMGVLLHDEAMTSNIRFTTHPVALDVRADPDLLRRVLINLLLNAFKACNAGDKVILSVEETGRERAAIQVRDTGCGIAKEDLPLVATPYFTRFEEGVGLGLALVAEIAHVHGWRLNFSSTPGNGATVRVEGIQTMKDRS